MKIIKEKSRVYKGTPYYKYKINIPELVMIKSKFKAGDELNVEVEEGKIILKKN